MFESARTLLDSVVGLAHTRLELLGVELQEAFARLAVALLWWVATLCALTLALAFAGLALVAALWDSYRVAAAAGLAGAFLALGLGSALAVRRYLREAPPIFAASLTELEGDRAVLR